MAGAAARRRRPERGFTLVELALVVAIVAVLVTLALPRLPRFGRSDLEASADRLASTMTWLADEASLRGRIYRLTVDLDRGRWDVAALAPWSAEQPGAAGAAAADGFRVDAGDEMARSIALPEGVAFDAVTDGAGEAFTGTRPVFFLPEGAPWSVDVRLVEEEGGATTVVHLDAPRGRAWREATVEDNR